MAESGTSLAEVGPYSAEIATNLAEIAAGPNHIVPIRGIRIIWPRSRRGGYAWRGTRTGGSIAHYGANGTDTL